MSSAVGAVSVTRMVSGDHACLGFDDDESLWEIRAAYADIGVSRDENVVLFTDLAITPDIAAERLYAHGFHHGAALTNGQLVVRNEVPGASPGSSGGFAPAERVRLWMELTMQARSQGYSGIRIMGDMGWAAAPGCDHDLLVEYEAGLSPLFADIGFTAICEYDRRMFGDDLWDRVLRAHSHNVLPRLGALDVTRSGSGLRVAGEADLNTREQFMAVLAEAFSGPGRVAVLDLTELCFMDVRSAAALVHMASRHLDGQALEVRCRPEQSTVIRLCGSARVPQLVIDERSSSQ
ncbi:MEDS domain-containing protein [Streptomyces sp. NPDC047117]|uniref:MEDS domain-containing protein n=1 Tax=unclassified Streptomyces TaxID=2593676 RepID=UPI0033ED7AAC